ncbi:MAG: TRAP transporter small permease [Beijerinckiaceae bacterium]|nr:TRAP transporter small permease [Beijerinckiaceae bacterium]
MQKLDQVINVITDLLAKFAAVMLAVIVVSTWIEVVSRYFFHAPTNVSSSLAKHMVMVAVMSMLPWLSRDGYHVAMSFVYEKAPARYSKPIAIVITALCGLICLLSAWIAYGETYRQYAGDIKNIDVIEFPLWWVTAFMVYGFLFAAYHFARQAITGNVVQRSEV